jgi:hypothetical protein
MVPDEQTSPRLIRGLKAAGAYTGLGARYLRRHLDEIPRFVFGRVIAFAPEDLDSWMDAHRRDGDSERPR